MGVTFRSRAAVYWSFAAGRRFMPDAPTPSSAPKTTPPERRAAPDAEFARPGTAAELPHSPAHLLRLQRTVGNRAVQRLLQREPAPEAAQQGGAVAIAQQQPTPVQLPLFKANDYVSAVIEGQIEYPNPDPNAPSPVISAGEFGQTLKSKSIEFSASLMKMPNPLDESMNQWLDLGANVKVSTSLAAFKLATDMNYKDLKDVEVGLNVGEIEIAFSGKFDHTTMQSGWGARLLGGTGIGQSLAKKKAVFVGTIKLNLALPAEDALRLAQIAAHHKQLRAMAYQTKMWKKKIAALKYARKELELAWKTTKDAFARMNIAKQLGENAAEMRKLGKAVAKNKKLGRKLLAEAAKIAKSFSAALKATLGRFIPIINALLLISDAVKAIEVIYGLITGKGYTFSLGGEEGGDGSGEGLDGGSAAEGEGIDGESADANAAAEDAEFAGAENQAAGGGDEFSKPAELNPNALLVYNLLINRTSGELSNSDMDMLNTIVSSDLGAEHMERLLSALQTARLGSTPFKALAQVMTFTKQARDAVENKPSADGTGKQGPGAGNSPVEGEGGAGAEEDIVLLEDDQSYGETQAQSQSSEQLAPNANENAPESANPVPAKQGETPAPPEIDPDIREFMLRAMAAIGAGQGGYAEMDNGVTYNSLSPGDEFSGLVAVLVPTTSKNPEGQVIQSEVWYGGEARFKVLQKLPEGQLSVIRSVMQAYNRYGRFVGTVGAAVMKVGYQGQLEPQK